MTDELAPPDDDLDDLEDVEDLEEGLDDDEAERWLSIRGRRRTDKPDLPSVAEAVERFTAELPEVVAVDEPAEGWPGGPGEVVARRVDLACETSRRRVRLTATYRSEVVPKTFTFVLTFPTRRLRRHARDDFTDEHGFAFDELFEVDEVLFHTVDWWHEGDEHHAWPPPLRPARPESEP